MFRRKLVDSDLDEELRSYRQLLEDEKLQSGADSATARREATIELGGMEMIKDEVRDIRKGSSLEGFGKELRQSLRSLRRNPGMTAMAVLMLALGIGASSAIFSVFETVLLRPLPFRDPGRLVELVSTWHELGMNEVAFSEANFWDFRARNRSFESVGLYHGDDANLTGDGQPERVSAPRVSVDFFRTLGVAPILGRDFSGTEDRAPVAILGNKFWKSRYQADAAVLGKTLRLNGATFTVIGVLPPGEPWIDDQVYLPAPYNAAANRSSAEFFAVGRLAKGVSADAAQADLDRVAASLAGSYPKDDKGIGFASSPSSRWIAPATTGRALRILLAAVALLLLIACLNVMNLLLVRGLGRRREIALRTALGAARGRLVRFIMLESLLLSAFGAGFGLLIAYGALHILRTLEIGGLPRLDEVSLDPRALAFAAAAALLTGILCGLAPVLQIPDQAIATALREGNRQAGASRRQGSLRSVLVTAEIALAFVLLVGAGLLARSFQALTNGQRGFQTHHRLVFSISYPQSYGENGVGKQFIDRFLDELSANRDIVASGAVSVRPVQGPNYGMGISAASRRLNRPPWAGWRVVTPGYLRAAGLPLLRGRIFDATDKSVSAERGQPEPTHRTVMLSAALEKVLFPNEDPIGKHVLLWNNRDAEVVGVAGDSLERGLDRGPALTVYLPYGRLGLPSEFLLETRGDPMAVVPAVRSVVARLDPNLPIADIRTFDDVVNRSISSQRLNTSILAIFSGLALLLASFGIYSVLSYSVTARTAEIGVRMALGANPSGIVGMTVRRGLRPAFLGVTIGGVAAYALSGFLQSLLFGIRPFDLITYAAVVALLLAIAALASWAPARRAARTDPVIALRLE
ncbi:MAG TPA: ABC transporter permease [Candidatus Sulfopaludibacter sp.]|nr:ABC transporter permease [Candidatus Sulfopaludibacter sp.]